MITTLDNVTLKRGQAAWEIGVTTGSIHKPTRSIVHGQSAGRLANPDRCWADYDECLKECDKLNQRSC